MPSDYSDLQNEFIKQMGLGVNISRIYPKGHPSLQPVIQRFKILLKEMPLEKESISLVVIEDVIMIEDQRFDSRRLPMVKSLVDRFAHLEVKSITFDVDVSEEDLQAFFTAMAATPADLADYGDIVALIRAKGITGVRVNKFRVGVVSSEDEVKEINWDNFLESIVLSQTSITDEERIKQLGSFLAGVGVIGNEAAEVQSDKVVVGLEKLSLMIADQYGEERWNEYSMIFSRILAVLSPSIKKNVVRYKTENKKLSVLFKSLIPSMQDEDIIDIIATRAKEKGTGAEDEIVDILKLVTGTRLPGILSSVRVNVPELDFEKIVARLMSEMKTTKGTEVADKFMSKNLETEMRSQFPKLRAETPSVRITAIDELMKICTKLFEAKDYELIRLLVDRFDAMTDAEEDLSVFKKIADSMQDLYIRSKQLEKDDVLQFISRKFSKHLIRKEKSLLDKKKIIIRLIGEIRDQNYLAELVSLLWDPGTFVEAREALITLAEFSAPLLIETLKDADDRSVRMKIVDVLIRMGQHIVPSVTALLSSPDWFVRRNGVLILGEMKAAAAVDAIFQLMNDSEERVQIEVLESLNKIGDTKCRDLTKTGMNSKYRRVALMAMKYSAREDIRVKLPEVIKWLKERRGIPDAKEEKFRKELIDIIGVTGDNSAIGPLKDILDERSMFRGDLLLPTKEAVLYALAKIGSPEAIDALRKAANHKDQFVSGTALDILQKMDYK